MNFFNKTENVKTLSEKYNYIKNHFHYYTMNSWNNLTSIANKVKIYSLGLSNEQEKKAYDIIYANDGNNEFWLDVNFMIEQSELNVAFNGRSDGYLVLYNDKNYCSALAGEYDDKNYKEYCKSLTDFYSYSDAHYLARTKVESDFELVKQFDIFCDEIRDTLIYYCDNFNVVEVEEEYTAIRKYKSFELISA